MKRNMYRVLYRNKTMIGKKGALKQMFNELYGDRHQVVQLASLAGNFLKADNVIAGGGDVKNICTIESI